MLVTYPLFCKSRYFISHISKPFHRGVLKSTGGRRVSRKMGSTTTTAFPESPFCALALDKPPGLDKKYLLWISNEHANFIKPELEALFKIFDLDRTCLDGSISYGPLICLDLASEEYAHQILSRSVLIHSCYEVWGYGTSLLEMHSNFQNNIQVAKPYESSRFRIRVDNYGKKITQAAKLDVIHTFDYIPLHGEIDLSNPECSLHLIQYYGIDSNNIPEHPHALFFGRWIGDGQRRLISKISLKTRKFIGNTSMDPMLSLLMSNVGLVGQDSLVLDPFVGTGSLLVASAVMGGYVFGTDIDYQVIHAKTKPTKAFVTRRAADESIYANLKQYGVEGRYLDVLVSDASLPIWREELKFDAIITDPPYGVRESTEKIGSDKADCRVPEELLGVHYPQKVTYSLGDIFRDLIFYAGKRLRMGGRLVCWIPVSRPHYKEDHLPHNPCFKLVGNCEQALTTNTGRRLLIFEKIGEPNEMTTTVMDCTSEMYRFKFDVPRNERPPRKERKLIAASAFGNTSKRGQLFPNAPEL